MARDKAQVHAGGRGKGGGVKLAKNLKELHEDVYYPGDSETSEFYMSVLLNRGSGKNMIMYSTEGGMDIEEVAESTPHLIFTEEIDPGTGLLPFQARKIAFNLGLSGGAFKEMTKFVASLYKAYVENAKVSIDDNALYRRKQYLEMRDLREENPIEVEAGALGLNYVDLDGNVGCMVNGAGLAMATMDLIKMAGGEPANFLDVGGTADAKRVEGGFSGLTAELAKEIIDNSGLAVQSAVQFQEAADKVKEVLS
ncbi:Succinate--CoA ligase [ADP-forming] subunit beta [Nymphon striatum]|nr:Succinate--CoA ligase [ADP-forming] subunit beta [Nymphon striatum]